MKKLLFMIGIACGITFCAFSQQAPVVFEVTIEQGIVVYRQLYSVEADSVEVIGYKIQALDKYVEEKQPAPAEATIIENEKTFLNSERTRILMESHPERMRK